MELFPPATESTAARYAYYAVDIVTNRLLAQIPLEDVTYERALKGAGTFDGKISINKQTKDLDLYNSTLPGKTALYVVRNGVCMWGGIIWGRTYDLMSRSLNLTASEFTSYLKHRTIWKTYSYQFTATVRKRKKADNALITLTDKKNSLKVPLSLTDDYGNLNNVYVSFLQRDLMKYSGYYPLASDAAPTSTEFYVAIPKLPGLETDISDVSISVRVDTYDYLRELMREVSVDFVDTDFANEVLAPGIRQPFTITNIAITNDAATLTTQESHTLVAGQRVTIANVHKTVDGEHSVSEVPSANTFRIATPQHSVKKVALGPSSATVSIPTSEIVKYKVGSYINITSVPTTGGIDFNQSSALVTAVSGNEITYVMTNPMYSAAVTGATSSLVDKTTTYTSAGHSLNVGDVVTIYGISPDEYNKEDVTITAKTTNTFTIAAADLEANISQFVISGTVKKTIAVTNVAAGLVRSAAYNATDVNAKKYTVHSRQIVKSAAIAVTHAARKKSTEKSTWIVTLYVQKNHPYSKGDTVTTDLKKASDGKEAKDFTSLTNGDGGGVVLTSVDKAAGTVSYELTGKSTKKSGSYIGDTGKTKLKSGSKINFAVPISELELSTSTINNLDQGDYIYVGGVDGVAWTTPIYNGYHTIKSIPAKNNAEKAVSDGITAYALGSDGVATLYTAANNIYNIQDDVTVSGFTGSGLTQFNGKFKIIDAVQGDDNGESYFTYLIPAASGTYSKTAVSGFTPVASVMGQSLFRYDMPEYSVLGEPDTSISPEYYTYKGTEGSRKYGIVTIWTKGDHGLNVGDSVKVSLKDLVKTDGTYKVQSVPSKDRFTYFSTKSPEAKKSNWSTKAKCSGTITRTYSVVGPLPRTTVPITRIQSISNYVSVYSPNHNLPVDSQIVVTFNDGATSYYNYDNYGSVCTITESEENYFKYIVNTFRPGVKGATDLGIAQVNKYKLTVSGSTKTVTLTTTAVHGYVAGQNIVVTGVPSNKGFNGHYVISAVPTTTTIEYKINTTSSAVAEVTLTAGNYARAESYLALGSGVTGSAYIDYSRSASAHTVQGISTNSSSSTVTVYAPDHGFVDDDLVKMWMPRYSSYEPASDAAVYITRIDDNKFSYTRSGVATNWGESGSITGISFPVSGTVRFAATNDFSVGDSITIYGVVPDVYNLYNVTVTGRSSSYFEISSTQTAAYSASSGKAMRSLVPAGTAVQAPYVSASPVVFSRSYGEFPNNAGLGGLDFGAKVYSKNFFPNTIVRGSDLITLDAHFEQYTNSVHGFDYRIDCTLVVDPNTGNYTFKRAFVFVPVTPTTLDEYLRTQPNGVLPKGEVAPPYAFGADKITFEHPGNVQSVNLSESAENSATRMFVSGNNDTTDPNGSARFSGAVDSDLLQAGWPILDRAEKAEWPTQYNPLVMNVNLDGWGNYDAEGDFYKTAQRFLYQSRPPQGDFIIRVNGSLPPVIGTYNPGDWCQLIVDDESGYINSRLESVLEPRKDVILRRIDNIKVSVPNSPAFPEDIDLTLTTNWEVDRIGK